MVREVRRAYGHIAGQYIELFASTTATHPSDVALITKYLSHRRGAVLDVGCGPGHFTAHLHSMGIDVTGIDLVPEFIGHARHTYRDPHFVLGSMQHLPVADHAVVGILAWYSLIHHRPHELDETLTELRRVIAPGGTLVVGFFESDHLTAFDHKVLTGYSWPVDQMSEQLGRAGFTEVARQQRAGNAEHGIRPQAAIVAGA